MSFPMGQQKWCTGCKRRRNIVQFDGKETCRLCRGIKTPVKVPTKPGVVHRDKS